MALVLVLPAAAAWSLGVFWGERGCYWQHTDNGANFEVSGRFRDSESTVVSRCQCPGFWLSMYFRPYGALVRTRSSGPGGGRAPPWLESGTGTGTGTGRQRPRPGPGASTGVVY